MIKGTRRISAKKCKKTRPIVAMNKNNGRRIEYMSITPLCINMRSNNNL